jgi:hypothetical protein
LNTPQALLDFVSAMANNEANGNGWIYDPRASTLLRALSQEALLTRTDQAAAPAATILEVYRPLSTWLDSGDGALPETRSTIGPIGPQTGGPLLWPPTPLSTLVSAEQTIRRFLHYPETDPARRLLGIYLTNQARTGIDEARALVESVIQVVPDAVAEARARGQLLGDLYVGPRPVLVGPLSIEAYRRWWPAVGPELVEPQAPFVITVVVAPLPEGNRDYAAVSQNGRIIASIGDENDDNTDRDSKQQQRQERQRREGVYPFDVSPGLRTRLPLMPMPEEPWVEVLEDILRTVREGRPDLVGLARVQGPLPIAAGLPDPIKLMGSAEEPASVYMGAFDPADVMAAVDARIPEYNEARIQQALSNDTMLDAIRAQRTLATEEPDIDAFVAPYAAIEGCAADASPDQRARVVDAARALGVDPDRFLDWGPLCAEVAEAAVAQRGVTAADQDPGAQS